MWQRYTWDRKSGTWTPGGYHISTPGSVLLVVKGLKFHTLRRIQVMQIWQEKLGDGLRVDGVFSGPETWISGKEGLSITVPGTGSSQCPTQPQVSNIHYQHQRPMISPCLTALKSIPSKNWAQLSQQKPFTQPNFPTRAQGARHPLHSTHCSLMFFESHHSLGVHPACMHWNCHLLS